MEETMSSTHAENYQPHGQNMPRKAMWAEKAMSIPGDVKNHLKYIPINAHAEEHRHQGQNMPRKAQHVEKAASMTAAEDDRPAIDNIGDDTNHYKYIPSNAHAEKH